MKYVTLDDNTQQNYIHELLHAAETEHFRASLYLEEVEANFDLVPDTKKAEEQKKLAKDTVTAAKENLKRYEEKIKRLQERLESFDQS